MKKMKKKMLIVFMAAVMAGTISACSFDLDRLIGIFNQNGHGNDQVSYYGCPNSKKVKKLNLKKSRRA